MVLTEYPDRIRDLAVVVMFTEVKIGPMIFKSGHRLSNGFSFSRNATVYPNVMRVTREQADLLLAHSSPCGFAAPGDVHRVRAFVKEHTDMISDREVRDLIESLGW